MSNAKSFSHHFVRSTENLLLYLPEGWENCSEEKRRLATWSEEQLLKEIDQLELYVRQLEGRLDGSMPAMAREEWERLERERDFNKSQSERYYQEFTDETLARSKDVERLSKIIHQVHDWIEKATKGDEGSDWDDVFQARKTLREFTGR